MRSALEVAQRLVGMCTGCPPRPLPENASGSRFPKLLELTQGTLEIEVHDVAANDEHAVALVSISASRNGRSSSGTSADVFRIRNGRAVEFWDNVTDRYGLDEVFNA